MKIIMLNSWQQDQAKKLEHLVRTTGWNENQIKGQLATAEGFIHDREHCIVIVALNNDEYIGFILGQFYAWNRLSQIHGLIVHPDWRKQRIATQLISHVEEFMKTKSSRGIYVDTPINNIGARKFYEKIGYKQDYIMTEYYDEGSDGVTYLKLFKWKSTKENKCTK